MTAAHLLDQLAGSTHAPEENEMKDTYRTWLKQQGYVSGTVQAQMHRAGRVEEHYGDLDEYYDRDQLRSVVDRLRYSTADERNSKPNPSKASPSITCQTQTEDPKNEDT